MPYPQSANQCSVLKPKLALDFEPRSDTHPPYLSSTGPTANQSRNEQGPFVGQRFRPKLKSWPAEVATCGCRAGLNPTNSGGGAGRQRPNRYETSSAMERNVPAVPRPPPLRWRLHAYPSPHLYVSTACESPAAGYHSPQGSKYRKTAPKARARGAPPSRSAGGSQWIRR